MYFRTESRGNKLWLAPDSNFNTRQVGSYCKLWTGNSDLYIQDWLNENFKLNTRRNFYVFKAENILTPEAQMGVALKHAGVSITITTITDVFAFGVGAFSVSFLCSMILF